MPEEFKPMSPTVSALPPHRKPAPTVCTGCPAAVWYVLPNTVRCYCRMMNTESYTSDNPGDRVEECDGLIISTMELQRE